MFLGIGPSPYWYHQTLTFKAGVIPDVRTAHLKLKMLFDSLLLAYPKMGCFFVRGYQGNSEVHFHVIFAFYEHRSESPEVFLDKFKDAVFSRWQMLNDGELNRRANEIHLREKNFECIQYLLWHVQPSAKPVPREQNWHGIRNKRLFHQNELKIAHKEISLIYEKCFPKKPRHQESSPVPKVVVTERDVRRVKAYVRADGKYSWLDFKKSHKKRHLSDLDFVASL